MRLLFKNYVFCSRKAHKKYHKEKPFLLKLINFCWKVFEWCLVGLLLADAFLVYCNPKFHYVLVTIIIISIFNELVWAIFGGGGLVKFLPVVIGQYCRLILVLVRFHFVSVLAI